MRNLNQFADMTTGVVYIHSAPVALCPHVEWALSSTLNARANLKWSAQEADRGLQRATVDWAGPVGTAVGVGIEAVKKGAEGARALGQQATDGGMQ